MLVLVLTLFPVGNAAAQDAPPGATYTPLATPQRILDTRTPVGGHQRKIAAGETVALAVPGLPADATAVVVNLTGTGGSTSTFLSMFPDQYAGTSTLNLAAGQTAAAGAFVTLGADRRIRVLNRNGTIDAVVDLVGYFAKDGTGFTTATASRILDTRATTAIGPGATRTLAVRGAGGVPADATAVLLNVTGVEPTASTFLRVTPDGQAGTSTVNLAANVNRANTTVTRIDADGAVRITNNSGNTHVLVDVLGWFSPSGTGRYVPLASPRRVLDTREGTDGPIAARTTRQAYFATEGGVPNFPTIATLFTLTGVQPTASTYLTAWGSGTARPQVSTLSVAARATVPNTAVAGGTAVNVYNHAGSSHALVDAVGYFYTPTRPDPTLPGAPTISSVRNDGTRVSLNWTTPDNGGLPLTGYTVTLQPGARRVTVPGWQNSATVDGLTSGGRYTLTVTATNLAGDGPASAAKQIGPPAWMTRVDTTATGQSDPDPRSWLGDVSADGRYVLLSAQTNSVLVPAPYRTAESQGRYQVRKDRQTGAVEITSVGADGVPAPSGWSALAPDNRTLVFLTTSGIHVRDLVAGTTRTVVAERGTGGHTLSGNGRWLYWTFQRTLYRYDLQAGQAETLLSCTDPATGCHLASAPVVSDDGATVVFDYSPAPGTSARAALLDPVTKELRMLVETDHTGALVLSGDGTTLFYRCDNCGTHTIKKVGTAPGSTPVPVGEWSPEYTMTVSPTASSTDGRVLSYFRQRRDGYWFISAPGYVLDTVDGREAMLPQLREISYLRGPVMSADGSTAVAEEDCQWQEECGATGVYAVSVPELLSSSG
ncbi:fibronectin type III domain-containing protein [Actinophytocola algeriensis]|uniref:Fibronectin type-III domain-containing protein n=1 Tax=Actinophytocola algeriensis TaxID=1768010 RepID=A0A7W7QFV8_9PSEU|nr:fibronectin type III domain-containing protein [Actinophytocola algeriensis]MBB4912604.1 hypothetical protein [Actinophytocola algeriensis]MBE1478978.1 hypothetical protein [Actinophytocola algeriensis]